MTTTFSSSVQEEVDRGSFLLPVRPGHPGEHPVRPERPPEEPRLGSGREKLPGASLTLAGRQPRHPDVRPHCILFKKWEVGEEKNTAAAMGASGVSTVPHTCHILDRPVLAH